MNIEEFVSNECSGSIDRLTVLYSLKDAEPFPYRLVNLLYRPSVVTKKIEIFFGFRHDDQSWSIDEIQLIEQSQTRNLFRDGDFESNYLFQPGNYKQCILSNSRSSESEILFDLPFQGDFYYNDRTKGGMNYLSQSIDVTGGKYYQLTFRLENRGYPSNHFLVLVRF